MILNITQDARRILNQQKSFQRAVYRTLKDIEIVLDASYFKGDVVLQDEEGQIFMNICPARYHSSGEVRDICDQVSYLIKCNSELNLPFKYKGETFRYQNY